MTSISPVSTLPGFDAAVIPEEKLVGYALNLAHPVGGHKARVFAKALAIERPHWVYLHDQILEGLPTSEATFKGEKVYETERWQRWDVPILVKGRNDQTAVVATGWKIETGEADPTPSLVTTYVDQRRTRELWTPSER